MAEEEVAEEMKDYAGRREADLEYSLLTESKDEVKAEFADTLSDIVSNIRGEDVEPFAETKDDYTEADIGEYGELVMYERGNKLVVEGYGEEWSFGTLGEEKAGQVLEELIEGSSLEEALDEAYVETDGYLSAEGVEVFLEEGELPEDRKDGFRELARDRLLEDDSSEMGLEPGDKVISD